MRGVTSVLEQFYYSRKFQLTRLMRGVTTESAFSARRFFEFQLTRLMRGVTR